MKKFVDKFRNKSGTHGHPNAEITDLLVEGLARNIEETGRPLCPCRAYPSKKEEAKSSYWSCPCVPMRVQKFCA
jgi:ferredoxin-thioredoxin reductase catalytic chain